MGSRDQIETVMEGGVEMVGLTRLLAFAQYKYADTSLMEFQMALC